MSKTNPNTSINYLPERQLNSGDKPTYHDESIGITKREYFAALAMQSQVMIMANTDAMQALAEISEATGQPIELIVARKAVAHADGLIAALNGK